MSVLKRKIPAYLYEKSNLIRLIIFTAIFDLVFINLYKPFSSLTWYPISEFRFFIFSSLIILTGVLVVAISRLIMYYYTKKHELTYFGYSLWILFEIFFMALFYTIYSLSIKTDADILQMFKDCVENTSLILLLPYAIMILYFSWKDKEEKLKLLKEDKLDLNELNVISFHDEKGELRLSIKHTNFYYIESADNYVFIWYLNKGKLTKFILRNTLKAMEETFEGTNILRCHRSFIVNLEQVKVIRRNKDGIYLEFGVEKIPDIPISKTYSEKVTHWFASYSS